MLERKKQDKHKRIKEGRRVLEKRYHAQYQALESEIGYNYSGPIHHIYRLLMEPENPGI